jgi:methionyl-tRNA synthetase
MQVRAGLDCHENTYLLTGISLSLIVPHIGHLHSLVTADILARFRRLTHPQQSVRFLTGTDEHGLKIQKAAREQGLGEKAFCDGISERFRVGSFFDYRAMRILGWY